MSHAAGVIILNIMCFAVWQHAANGASAELIGHAIAWSLGVAIAGFILRDKEDRS